MKGRANGGIAARRGERAPGGGDCLRSLVYIAPEIASGPLWSQQHALQAELDQEEERLTGEEASADVLAPQVKRLEQDFRRHERALRRPHVACCVLPASRSNVRHLLVCMPTRCV